MSADTKSQPKNGQSVEDGKEECGCRVSESAVDEIAGTVSGRLPCRLPQIGEEPCVKVEEHKREVNEQPRTTNNHRIPRGVSDLFLKEEERKEEDGKELDGGA